MMSLIQTPEMSHTLGASLYMENAKIRLYNESFKKIENDPTFFVTALSIATESAIITLVFRISSLAEAFFKAFVNLFQSALNRDKEQALLGLRQLYLDLPIKAIQLAASIVEIPLGASFTAISLILDPLHYCKERALYHQGEWDQLQMLKESTFSKEVNPVSDREEEMETQEDSESITQQEYRAAEEAPSSQDSSPYTSPLFQRYPTKTHCNSNETSVEEKYRAFSRGSGILKYS